MTTTAQISVAFKEKSRSTTPRSTTDTAVVLHFPNLPSTTSIRLIDTYTTSWLSTNKLLIAAVLSPTSAEKSGKINEL